MYLFFVVFFLKHKIITYNIRFIIHKLSLFIDEANVIVKANEA